MVVQSRGSGSRQRRRRQTLAQPAAYRCSGSCELRNPRSLVTASKARRAVCSRGDGRRPGNQAARGAAAAATYDAMPAATRSVPRQDAHSRSPPTRPRSACRRDEPACSAAVLLLVLREQI